MRLNNRKMVLILGFSISILPGYLGRAEAQSLPPGWSQSDIGTVGVAGSANFANNVFTVSGAGSGIGGTLKADSFHFVYQTLSGDGSIVARVASFTSSSPQAGVMIRETLNAGSTYAFVDLESPSNPAVHFYDRPTTGGFPNGFPSTSARLPYWIKVTRSGSAFTGYASIDGINWVQLAASQTITMAQSVFIGLVVSSQSTTSSATATFDDVSINSTAAPAPVITSPTSATESVGNQLTITGSGFGTSQGSSKVLFNDSPVTINSWGAGSIGITIPSGAATGPLVVSVAPSMNDSNPAQITILPPGWLDQDIGTVNVAGSASFTNGVFTVSGSGSGVGSTADGFNFAYQSLSGDATIVARIASNNPASAQAGVMIRETLNQGATEAYIEISSASPCFFARASTGGNASSQCDINVFAPSPYWVKLVRTGGTFNAYRSSDGENWFSVGSTQTVAMQQNVFIGLGVSQGGNQNLANTTFDSVSINSTATPAPVITSVSATTGSVGSQVVITGSGFGTSQGSSVVLLDDVAMTIKSWGSGSITITIAAGAISGPLVVSVAPSMNDSNPVDFTVETQPLPTGWLDQDIGDAGLAGNATFSNGVFTVNGAGANGVGLGTVNTADGFHFVYQLLSGDGSIVARIVSRNSTAVQVGVMIRETLDKSSTLGYAVVGSSPEFYIRSSTGSPTSVETDINSGAPIPYWAKMVRKGSGFSAYRSSDGVNWELVVSTVAINMATNVYIGLGVSSNSSGTMGTATFDNVSVSATSTPGPVITSVSATTGSVGSQVVIKGSGFGSSRGSSVVRLNDAAMTVNTWSSASITITIASGATSGSLVVSVAPGMVDSNAVAFTVTSNPLPAGWLDQDIGDVGLAGSASFANGVFTVKGSGNGVANTADAFHFVYQPVTSNVTIVGRVASVAGSSNPQAGVMIRDTLDAFSPEAFSFYLNPSTYLDDRTLIGGGTAQTFGQSVTLPYWFKIVRAANVLSAFNSPDGTHWTQIGTNQTLTTAQQVYVGLGVSSDTTSFLDSATFDNVSITTGTSLPNPVITSLSATTGPPGLSVTINGSGFGTTQGTTSTVNFNGTAAAVASWSDTLIKTVVPAAATSGPVSVVVGNITALGPTFTIVFTVQVTDSLNNQSTYTSQVFGSQWTATDSQGPGCSTCTVRGNIHNQYDSNGNILWTTDPLGNTTVNRYDSSNNVISVTAPIDANTVAITKNTYNNFGEVQTMTDPLGNVTTNAYDGNGNLTSITTPMPDGSTLASLTSFTYYPNGLLKTITDPLNNVTTITYFPQGYIQTITDAQNNVTSYTYDTHGNRKTVTDALNHVTKFDYDTGDRLKTITYPDQTTMKFGYDYRGRRTTVTDQNNNTTTYGYDDADRLAKVTDASTPANVTTYSYDTESNLKSIQDAKGNITKFDYDAFDNLKTTTFPSTLTETYTYDADNNLKTKTDRKNQMITYVYDALSRLTKKQYPDSTEVDYVYDLASKVQSVNDPTGTYTFAYDHMGRLTGTTTSYSFLARNITTSYGYDKASNRASFTDPEGGITTYAPDTLNRLQTLTPPAAFGSGSFGFNYDTLSRRKQLTRPNNVTTTYNYDNLSHLLSVLHQLSGSTIDGATYVPDNAGNRKSKTDNRANVTSNYGYDAIYELKTVTQGATTTESYTYDPVGNRLSSLNVPTYVYNSSNEMKSEGTTTVTYDNNGNPTQTTIPGVGTATLSWDFENRLISTTLPGPTNGTVTFQYDPFGRRIQKASPEASIYLYDGDNLIEEVNATGAVVARYTQGLNIDEPLAMLRSGTTSYYQADGLGSITSLSNGAGALAQTYTYDSFGNTTASTGTLTNPFQYTARELDTETNLYFYRARYYDSNSGRFLSEDPVGFDAGSNFYSYVGNLTTTLVDPFGLQESQGGPWHPPQGVKFGCRPQDDCSTLSKKIDLFKETIASHLAWDIANKTDRHADEIKNLLNGLDNCILLHQLKCINTPPRCPPLVIPAPQREPSRLPVPVPVASAAVNSILVIGGVIVVAVLCPECLLVLGSAGI